MPYHHFTKKSRYVIAHMADCRFFSEGDRPPPRKAPYEHQPGDQAEPADLRGGCRLLVRCCRVLSRKSDATRPRHQRRQHERLVAYVTSKLRLDWSPEAISGRLKVDYPDDEQMRISHETIYRWIYLDSRNKGRSPPSSHDGVTNTAGDRSAYGSGRRFIPGRVSIDLRPPVVATRERFGDWEGDTMEGGKGTGHLATHVERKSRYLIAAKLTDKKASTMTAQSISALQQNAPETPPYLDRR